MKMHDLHFAIRSLEPDIRIQYPLQEESENVVSTISLNIFLSLCGWFDT